MSLKQRFQTQPFTNRSGTTSYRVTGTRKDGSRVRENYTDAREAQVRQAALECEFHTAGTPEVALRSTRLTDSQIQFAQAAFDKLLGGENPCEEADILRAVDKWLTDGKPKPTADAPLLDDAVKQFTDWLESKDCDLREPTKKNLRLRVSVFANSTGRLRVDQIDANTIYAFLAKRDVSKASKNNDQRALSRFFGWCATRPRQWVKTNPARKEHRERRTIEETPPQILTVDECRKFLSEAEKFKGGRLVPYVVACLFGGLRPFEAQRLTWAQINLADGEIRLEGSQTKTGTSRTVRIVPEIRGKDGKISKGPDTFRQWLQKYEGKEFFPSNWRRDFDALKATIGYNGSNRVEDAEGNTVLRPWEPDVLRHTSVTHFFRLTGSYGDTALQYGNSESIIKKHYQSREGASTADTKAFYKLLPKKK